MSNESYNGKYIPQKNCRQATFYIESLDEKSSRTKPCHQTEHIPLSLKGRTK